MKNYYSRTYEHELIQKLGEYDVDEHDLLMHFLDYLSSDQTCEILEDYCDQCDIDYEEVGK